MIFLLYFPVSHPFNDKEYLPEKTERQYRDNTEYRTHYKKCIVKAFPAVGSSKEIKAVLAAI